MILSSTSCLLYNAERRYYLRYVDGSDGIIDELTRIIWTPLILAYQNGHTEIVKLLLSQPGIEINCKAIFFIDYIDNIPIDFVLIFQFEIICNIIKTAVSYIQFEIF